MTDEVTAGVIETLRRELREAVQDDMGDIVRRVFREELHAVGLRVNDAEDVDQAREDLRFLRRLRKASDGVAAKIGYTILGLVTGGMLLSLWVGIKVHILRS